MEINPGEIAYKIGLLNRLRLILVLLIRVLMPILAALIIIEFIGLSFASALKLNTDIFFYPLSLIVGITVLFTPFLFYVLIKEKRKSWVIIFFVIVVLPCLFVFAISFGKILSIKWMIALVVPFYIYFYLLKHTVDEWLEEYEGQEMRKERKIEESRRMKEEKEWM